MSDVKQLKIEEYDIVSFVMQIQQGIRDGYEVTDKSDDAPMQIGGGWHAIMREAAKPNITVGKLVMEASIDTTKLQEQLKAGGELEEMLADSLVVDEPPIPSPEPTLDESLPKEEQAMLQNKQPTKRGRK